MLKKPKKIYMFKANYYLNDSEKTMALYCSKRLFALFRGIKSKHNVDSNYTNFLHSFRTKLV